MKITWDAVKAMFKGDEAKAKEFLDTAEKLKKGVQQFAEYKTTEGILVKVEPELTQGAMVVLEDGSPAPDGEHLLEGGVKIMVKDGMVAEIEKEDMGAQPDQAMKQVVAEFAALKKELAALKTELAAIKKEKFVKQDSFEELKNVTAKFFDLIQVEGKPENKTPKKQTPAGSGNEPVRAWQRLAQMKSQQNN